MFIFISLLWVFWAVVILESVFIQSTSVTQANVDNQPKEIQCHKALIREWLGPSQRYSIRDDDSHKEIGLHMQMIPGSTHFTCRKMNLPGHLPTQFSSLTIFRSIPQRSGSKLTQFKSRTNGNSPIKIIPEARLCTATAVNMQCEGDYWTWNLCKLMEQMSRWTCCGIYIREPVRYHTLSSAEASGRDVGRMCQMWQILARFWVYHWISYMVNCSQLANVTCVHGPLTVHRSGQWRISCV